MIGNHELASEGAPAASTLERRSEASWADAWETLAENTRRAYRTDWTVYTAWARGTSSTTTLPLAPEVVATFVRDRAALHHPDGRPVESAGTIKRRTAALGFIHRAAGHPSPIDTDTVRDALTAVRRRRARTGRDRTRRATALTLEPLGLILAGIDITTWPAAVGGRRDRALILTGWVTAMRRSELAGLQRRDLVLTPGQGRITLRSSKTDQDAHGQVVVLPPSASVERCAPCALWRWMDLTDAADRGLGHATSRVAAKVFSDTPQAHVCARPGSWADDETSLFRAVTKSGAIQPVGISGETVNLRLRKRALEAGVATTALTAHSLRAGFVTEALEQDLDPHHIMRQTRHTSLATLRVYERHEAPETANAAMELRL